MRFGKNFHGSKFRRFGTHTLLEAATTSDYGARCHLGCCHPFFSYTITPARLARHSYAHFHLPRCSLSAPPPPSPFPLLNSALPDAALSTAVDVAAALSATALAAGAPPREALVAPRVSRLAYLSRLTATTGPLSSVQRCDT